MSELSDPKFDPIPPHIPNFLKLEEGENYMPIWRFSESQLRKMAQEWTEELIAQAHKRRKKYEKEKLERKQGGLL